MFKLKNIVICVTKSEHTVRLARLVARMFPNSVFHVLAVIPRIRSRTMYTSLFKDTVVKIVSEAVEEVEVELMRESIFASKKAILYGKPVKEIVKYVKRNSIDLLSLTSSVTEPPSSDLVGGTVAKLLGKLEIPFLIYPPVCMKVPRKIENILLLTSNYSSLNKALLIARAIAKLHNSTITLATLPKQSTSGIEWFRRHMLRLDISIDIITIRSRSIEDLAEKLLKESKSKDLLIVDRRALGEHRLLRFIGLGGLSVAEKMLIALSQAPIILT